jgi:hypothetical protein
LNFVGSLRFQTPTTAYIAAMMVAQPSKIVGQIVGLYVRDQDRPSDLAAERNIAARSPL